MHDIYVSQPIQEICDNKFCSKIFREVLWYVLVLTFYSA